MTQLDCVPLTYLKHFRKIILLAEYKQLANPNTHTHTPGQVGMSTHCLCEKQWNRERSYEGFTQTCLSGLPSTPSWGSLDLNISPSCCWFNPQIRSTQEF